MTITAFKDFLLAEGVNDPNIFKAIFLAGGPGSGKGYVSDRTTGGNGLVTSNSDTLFEIGMGKAGLSLKMDDIKALDQETQRDAVRAKAKVLTAKKLKLWINGRLGIIIDGTGHNYELIKKQADSFQQLGYDTSMIFVNTSLDVAKARNQQRARTVPDDVVENRWHVVQKNIGKFQRYFGGEHFIVVDNNAATDSDLEKVWKGVRRLLSKPVTNRVALEWIATEKQKAKH